MEFRSLLMLLVLLGAASSGKDCPAGSFLHNNECKSCPEKSYTDSRNTRSSCNRCRQCQGGKFLILKQCTAISNTKCGCDKGFFCTNKDCQSCAAHKVCGKGQEVLQKGDSYRNTVCRDCRNGNYSGTQGGVCKPWTDCLAKGLQVARNGSRTEDVMCGLPLITPTAPTSSRPSNIPSKEPDTTDSGGEKKNEGIAGIIAVILLPCVFITFGLYMAVLSRNKQKQLPLDMVNHEDLPVPLVTAGDDRCSCHCPEEEQGDWQLRQETVPKPPE
ncbi:tumor necrosis factor receptor superfamily member 9-like [Heptranchias perlo]|uniref:tumor necrosis factor receptor superfamily member 9-like n=1 Tax=Heptranchias perlo TaxID=212740 RepID=UPI0035594343